MTRELQWREVDVPALNQALSSGQTYYVPPELMPDWVLCEKRGTSTSLGPAELYSQPTSTSPVLATTAIAANCLSLGTSSLMAFSLFSKGRRSPPIREEVCKDRPTVRCRCFWHRGRYTWSLNKPSTRHQHATAQRFAAAERP